MTVVLVFHCQNCKLDFEEPFCELCGMRLTPQFRSVPEVEWEQLVDDLAHRNDRRENGQ